MTEVSITIDDAAALRALNRIQHSLTDSRDLMDRLGSTLVDQVRLTFRDNRDPWGSSWARLKDSTIARRRKGSDKPLRDTGRLMNGITHRVINDHEVEVGTNTEYASTHQFGARLGQYGQTRRGTPIPWGDIPARSFMPIRNGHADLPESWRRQLHQVAHDWLREIIPIG